MRMFFALSASVLSCSSALAADWIHLPAKDGTAHGKKIVFVTGDDEYMSEQSMPMMAHILAERHGFDCTVLFAINRQSGVIDTSQRDNIPGLEALDQADLMVIYTRFRTLADEQMAHVVRYLDSGRPVVGIRTATHAFDYPADSKSLYVKYGWNYHGEDYPGGFGQQVLGQTWVNHWGGHGRQSTRGAFAPGAATHPILRGIADGELWGPTDVYEASLPQPAGCQALVLGQILETMEPEAKPLASSKNDPMMPIAWTYARPTGAKGRVFTSTIGGAMAGRDDFASESVRRMIVNACFWAVGLEESIPAKSDVTPVLDPNPFKRGVKPEEALMSGLAEQKMRNSTILFYGNSMVERLLEHGEMEAYLQLAVPGLRVRSLAWTGDEVGYRLRPEGYAEHMKNLLAQWPANTIVLGYGMNESFAGAAGLADFRGEYDAYLSQLSRLHPGARFVLLSPTAIEGHSDVVLYAKAIAEIAKEHGAQFVDLFTQTTVMSGITSNGLHLNEKGNHEVAKLIAAAMAGEGALKADPQHVVEVAKAAAQKQGWVAQIVRPKNTVVYFGVRKRADEYAAEMPRYHAMIDQADAVVHELARSPGKPFQSYPVPALPPMPEGKGHDDGDRTGVIKSPADAMAEFKVADGYAVNLFASEEQFPELRNPVQIAFDARGRLWAVTMPSFPHTVPGLKPEDKIIVLEDTDRDGKADKLTTFAEGLDALDGVAFHHEGVIISEQPRHWLMNDTNGDGRADTRRELLRGIDMTDSHHGGMIAADPLGGVWFCDGVFHRSQLETPFGVHRGIDSTTYRHDLRTGRIVTEWQSITPNPWKITFDRWGNVFQMYGDGLVLDGLALTWTPLGGYHPFAYAETVGYGKGSAAASISSLNFPDEYQQGMASAALLGSYAVSLTRFDLDQGMVRGSARLDLVSSQNAAFRPADLAFGMDGALYVSDFCSVIIGHAQHPMRDPHWDHTHGRIWRIVNTAKPLVTDWPQIQGASTEALLALLIHPQDLVREHVRIELRKGGQAALKELDAWIAAFAPSDPLFDQAALETVFVAEGLGQTRPQLLSGLLKSKSALHRAAAVHVLRLQADRLPDVLAMFASVAKDPHPRVQMEVVDAVAHLRPTIPQVEQVISGLVSDHPTVRQMLSDLSQGTQPLKGRSVPVLEVVKEAQLTQWLSVGDGLYRTFVQSEVTQSAVVGVRYSFLDVSLNGVLLLSQDNQWSSDQQVQMEFQPGLNILEIQFRKLGGEPPAIFLYDPLGQPLKRAQPANDTAMLQEFAAMHDKAVAEFGKVLRVQAVPNQMQFSPKELRVTTGSKVRIVFDNPDLMLHNLVLIAPGSTDEIGNLADQLAAEPDGMAQGYVPASPKILYATNLISPHEKAELVFTVPDEPGEYPYICTFPGHWRIMRGILFVESAPPEVPTNTAVTFEASASAAGFKTLVPPTSSAGVGVVSTNQTTNNEPVASLNDGKLAENYGPVFGNGVTKGSYRIDLGGAKPVTAVSSWTFNQSGTRGAQRVTLYGSASSDDPGWNTMDSARFTPLGSIDSSDQTLGKFNGASLRASNGKPFGTFRWIVWSVSPVTAQGENSSFQELSVEVAK
jgi:putative membrane-bound dehydrogenase-like protein